MSPTDIPNPGPGTEEIVDPTIPAGDKAIVVIRRHLFGLVVFYIEVILGIALALVLLFLLVPVLDSSAARNVLAVASVVIAAIGAIFLIIMTALYRDNRWIVTDDNIVQVLRIGLFKIQTSGLSMANIEDVTSDRNGIFAQIFGFGTLKAETAGEKSNFIFIYCPKPDMYAKIILDARERFINEKPDAAERADMSLSVPKGMRAPRA